MTDLEESNRQFIDAWSLYARRSQHGAFLEIGGVTVAFSRVAMPLLNMMFLSSPVADAGELRRRVATAVAYGNGSGYAWMLTICEDWIPADARDEASQILAAAGLAPASLAVGMVADALAPPRRPAPELDIRPVDGQAARLAVADLNTVAYDMPLEWGHEALDNPAIFTDGVWGFVGYLGDAPVSTATTASIDGRLYVMLVATAAAHQRRGYAEAVMRRSLEHAATASGIRRTVLHATDVGLPLYAAMGYRPVGRFTMYALGGHS